MAIDHFTRQEFEAALPVHTKTGQPLWIGLGIDKGEFCYLIQISLYAGILIRSSVDTAGFSASTGEDSIRLWLVDPQTHRPCGPKLSKYVTRVPNWQVRMTNQLRDLWRLGAKVAPCNCGKVVSVYKVKADGPNNGRLFLACPDQHPGRLFEWLSPVVTTENKGGK